MAKELFGVRHLAKELGIEPASVRVQLRNHGIARNGRSYEWGSKEELKKLADKLRADSARAKPKGKAKAKANGGKPAVATKGKAKTTESTAPKRGRPPTKGKVEAKTAKPGKPVTKGKDKAEQRANA